MCVNHNLIVSGLFHGIKIVVYKPLAEMIAPCRNDFADITALYSIIAVVFHKLVSLIHTALVVTHRT